MKKGVARPPTSLKEYKCRFCGKETIFRNLCGTCANKKVYQKKKI